MAEVISFSDARKISCPIVYGIARFDDQKVVYVGKTTNPKKRLEVYNHPRSCHNPSLGSWLTENKGYAGIVVLEKDPRDLNASESLWISKLKGQTFNLVSGGDQAWRNHVCKPWAAGTSRPCPSEMILRTLRSRGFDRSIIGDLRSLRGKMNDVERCVFEVGIAMDFYETGYGDRIRDWLTRTEGRLMREMEESLVSAS